MDGFDEISHRRLVSDKY